MSDDYRCVEIRGSHGLLRGVVEAHGSPGEMRLVASGRGNNPVEYVARSLEDAMGFVDQYVRVFGGFDESAMVEVKDGESV